MYDWVDSIRAECFILADGAQEANGKLYILGGGWDTLYSRSFPFVHPQLALAIKLVIPWGATAHPHELLVALVDEDGASLLPEPPRLQFNVGRPPHAEPGEEVSMPVTITLNQLTIAQPGRYTVLLHVDGRIIARTSFRASRLTLQE
ncbi:MAG: hypothetical protein RMM58_14925 [Chloroflexota bacterium]|nr:hypothetical protein [Dehalococcoidia bacterium]MDW8255167.1 hypothetical protein [Chloroflexota bacterium]